ncbi:HlyD family efflux transporter periplasmic adaptor subunit [Henriciella sp. AS95]|uniref:HlyD family secretion protein n=1 Tax=Henriciella sp. AS95 TaxID=3135782 RepID=UPI00317430D4
MTLFRTTALALSGAALLAVAACSGENEPAHLGYVEADWTYVSAPAAGKLVIQGVREGDVVAPGDFIFQLDETAEQAALAEAEARVKQAAAEARNLDTGARDPEIRELRAALSEAEARLAKAEKDRDRIFPLIEQGLEPKARKDAIETEIAAAQAAVEAARQRIASATLPARDGSREAAQSATVSATAAKDRAAYQLSERRVMAPEAGRVEEVFYTAGEYVMPGAPVIAILPEGALKARFFVPQSELSSLKAGQTVRVTADGMANPANARISYIAHEAEYAPPVIYTRETRSKLVFLVEAELPAGAGFHPGLPVEVDW